MTLSSSSSICSCRKALIASSLFLLAKMLVIVQADYPSNHVEWESCGSLLCATLEFCQDGDAYGYRLPGGTEPCGVIPGPLIRMTPNNAYSLTLKNTAPDVATKTNIHTHGLHIVGDGDSDDVSREVEGAGSCLEYTWDIAADHPGGTYWYHPHFHGLVNEQVSGGAYGMLIIEDDETKVESWAWSDNEILLLFTKDGGTAFGNGNANEVIAISADRWYRLRVAAVTPAAKPSNLEFDGDACMVYKVASDGVWHSAIFSTYSGTSFELTGASRADFAIKCTSNGNIEWRGKIAATLQVGSGLSDPNYDNTNGLGAAPPRPNALIGIDSPVVVDEEDKFEVSLSASSISGASWDDENHGFLGTIAWNKVHEWTISGSGAHPFHLHLYHMLIVEPGGCGEHKEGEFYDTISASGSCLVRFKAADFGQKMVMHCHVLSHEDNGAMAYMDVLGTGMPENNVVSLSDTCDDGGSSPEPTPAPAAASSEPTTPQPVDTIMPVAVTTPAPQEVSCSSTTCIVHEDCCSGKCKKGACRGGRLLLRSQQQEDEE